MGLLERIEERQALDRLPREEQRAIGGVPWRPWDNPYWRFDVGGPVHPSRSGVSGGVDHALKLQPIYSSVRILAEGVAQIPIRQYRELDLGERQRMPLGQLLRKPSAILNTFDWLYQYVTSAALQGTAWGYITQRDGYGYPTSIEWLPPEEMVVDDPKPYNPAKVRIYHAGTPVPIDQLLIVRAFSIPGRTAGISPLRYFQLLIDSGIDTLAYGAGWYEGGGFPPGVFKNNEQTMIDEQSTQIKRTLVAAQRKREPLVIGRDWDYKPITVPPNEAQFVEAMQLNATQIAAIYGVPPDRVGGTKGDSMTYSSVIQDSLALITDTLDPWLYRLETALADCLPERQFMHFDRDARLRAAPQDRWSLYEIARNIGGMNPNEVRKREDMAPIPKPKDPATDYDGDDYTPLSIQVAAAKKSGELLQGIGMPGAAPAGAPAAPAVPGVPVPAKAPPGPPRPMPPVRPMPAPAAAANGNGSNGNGNGSGQG